MYPQNGYPLTSPRDPYQNVSYVNGQYPQPFPPQQYQPPQPYPPQPYYAGQYPQYPQQYTQPQYPQYPQQPQYPQYPQQYPPQYPQYPPQFPQQYPQQYQQPYGPPNPYATPYNPYAPQPQFPPQGPTPAGSRAAKPQTIIPGMGPAAFYKIGGKIRNKMRKRQHHGPPPPPIRLPTMSGNKKALVIGINYEGQDGMELKGCINDAERQVEWLERKGFEDIYVMTDHSSKKDLPTVRNIKRAIHWLTKDAQPGDSLFFHFSGHGVTNIIDSSGDESDGFDEAVLALDGAIVDDYFHNHLCENVPAGAQLVAVFDCCHSGTSMDMPYMFDGTNFQRTELRGDDAGVVVCFSAAKDVQVAADTRRGGMLTDAFQRVMERASYQPIPLGEVYRQITQIVSTEGPRLNDGHPQIVELASSHNVSLGSPLII